ncbi:MAG TPA: type II CAAX endopeptidase family protein [Coleofasciculaceae cyanobacterium]
MTTEQLSAIVKRLILVGLTILAIFSIGHSLATSLGQPQIQSRLELYQTNLLLHAAEWQGKATEVAKPQESTPDVKAARKALIGDKPFTSALEQYEEARKTAQTTQGKIVAKLKELSSEPEPDVVIASRERRGAIATDPELAKPQVEYPPVEEVPSSSQQRQQLQQSYDRVETLIDELDLRIGVLQAQQGKTDAALKTWNQFIERETKNAVSAPDTSLVETAQGLMALWSKPPRILPDAESLIQKNLEGWFRYQALSQLYQLQQRQDALAELQAKERKIAEQAVVKITLISAIPGFGGLLGLGLLVFLLGQWLIQGKRSLLATNGDVRWETPWNWEIIWQVFILGFFFIGQILLPLFFGSLGLNPVNLSVRMKAFYVLASYVLMATGGLLVLYFSVKPFSPLPEDWFRCKLRGNWTVWGIGGYLVALPLVILVSVLNQKLWQGQGGSNPILPLALEGQDRIALTLFVLTACVAAPIFEEIFFRGFLLPSLTRYTPVWGAILASALLFAIAHLSFSEVLPLFTLGIVLGVVYTRSRNLLASILLHGLWNAGTLLSLFVLGSGSN